MYRIHAYPYVHSGTCGFVIVYAPIPIAHRGYRKPGLLETVLEVFLKLKRFYM